MHARHRRVQPIGGELPGGRQDRLRRGDHRGRPHPHRALPHPALHRLAETHPLRHHHRRRVHARGSSGVCAPVGDGQARFLARLVRVPVHPLLGLAPGHPGIRRARGGAPGPENRESPLGGFGQGAGRPARVSQPRTVPRRRADPERPHLQAGRAPVLRQRRFLPGVHPDLGRRRRRRRTRASRHNPRRRDAAGGLDGRRDFDAHTPQALRAGRSRGAVRVQRTGARRPAPGARRVRRGPGV